MNKGTIVIILLVIILSYLGIIQFTGELEIFGLKFTTPFVINRDQPQQNNRQQVVIHPIKDLKIEIESLENKKQIYELGEMANITFQVKNTLGVPYNLSVDWFFDDTRYPGWKASSIDYFNVTQESNSFGAWYPVQYKGEWEVQVLIEYSHMNKTKIDEAITNFKVA